MPIEIKPETEALIEGDLRRGAYRDASEFVERAVAMLHDQEEWIAASREEIAAAIEAGYASAQGGGLLDEEQVRERMAARKQGWLAGSQQTERAAFGLRRRLRAIIRVLNGARNVPLLLPG